MKVLSLRFAAVSAVLFLAGWEAKTQLQPWQARQESNVVAWGERLATL